MEGASASGRAVRWKDEVKMENLDQFVMETAPQVFSLRPYGYKSWFFSFLSFLIFHLHLGKPTFQKSAVFLNIVQKAFDPPPFYLNICPILQGVFFKTRFWAFDIMYLFHPQISPSMPQKSLFMQISCC